LIEYKQEAFKAFEEMNFLVKSESIEKILKIQLVMQPGPGAEGFEGEGGELGDGSEGPSFAMPPATAAHAPVAAPPGPATSPAARSPLAPGVAEEQLEALRPKQRQRLVYSGPGEAGDEGGGPQMSRADRRRLERDKKKKRF
jgi:hypothetical protein